MSLPAGSWKIAIKHGPISDADTRCWPTSSGERLPYLAELGPAVSNYANSAQARTYSTYVTAANATDITLVCEGGSSMGQSNQQGGMDWTRTLGFDNLVIEAIRTGNLVVTDLPDMQIHIDR
jgi:hypothetical protein